MNKKFVQNFPHYPTFLIFGAYGKMGRVTAFDLIQTTKNSRIILAGRDISKLKALAQSLKSKTKNIIILIKKVNVTNIAQTTKLLKNVAVCLNATDYPFNLKVMEACLEARCHYADLGGLFHMTKKQLKLHKLFQKKKLIAILGCGGAPGITNVLAAHGAKLLDNISEIHIRFASKNLRTGKKHFFLPYSLSTLVDEFTKPAAVFEKGKIKFVKALSGREEEIFPKPIGKVTEFYTIHSELATFPHSFAKKGLKICDFKVSFDEDFIRYIKLLEKRNLAESSKEPNQFMQKCVRDMEYIRVRMNGEKKHKKVMLIFDVATKSKNGFSAGALDTGIPLSIIGQMIVNKKIVRKGVLPPEKCVEPEEFLRALKKRGIKIKMRSMNVPACSNA